LDACFAATLRAYVIAASTCRMPRLYTGAVRTLQIQHDHTNLLGAFYDVFHGAGEVDLWRTFEDPAPESLAPYDAVVLMGGVAMPDEDDRYPWIPQELRLLREGLERDLPMLGVCFGGQILARAAGGGVGPSPTEQGWFDIGLLQAGEDDPLIGPLGAGYRAFEWHHYNFEMPPDAVPLAINAAGNQAYRVGTAAWGLQFHIEVDRKTVDWWMDVGEWNLDEHGVDKDAMRADTDALVEGNAQAAAALAHRFVEIARQHGHA
jgi:GMP synthase-like glutamine amidotransferase